MGNVHLADDMRHDHALICGELAVLKRAKRQSIAQLWQTLEDVCTRLPIMLHEHIQREERLQTGHHRSLGAAATEAAAPLSISHHGDYRYLQVITRYIHSQGHPLLIYSRYQLLTDFLRGLRRNMDAQETELFQLINKERT